MIAPRRASGCSRQRTMNKNTGRPERSAALPRRRGLRAGCRAPCRSCSTIARVSGACQGSRRLLTRQSRRPWRVPHRHCGKENRRCLWPARPQPSSYPMAQADKNLPPRPRLIDALAKEKTLEMAAAAAVEKNPARRKDLEERAFRFWCDAYGRPYGRGRGHV